MQLIILTALCVAVPCTYSFVLGGDGMQHRVRRAPPSQSSSMSSAEEQIILEKHRELRAAAGAANMQYLTWSSDLANLASEWASQCDMAASDPLAYTATMGRNTLLDQGNLDLQKSVSDWHHEVQFFGKSAANQCMSNKNCQHYLQVVWAETASIGCAYKACDSVPNPNGQSSLKNRRVIACYYDVKFEVNKAPYVTGNPCSQCSSGKFWCYKGVCRKDCESDSSPCECKAACANCGSVSATCDCTCLTGYGGPTCKEITQSPPSACVGTSSAPDSNTVAESNDVGTSAAPDSNTVAESKDVGTSAVPDSNTVAESKDVGTSAEPDSNTVAESKNTGTSAAPDSNTAAESKDVGTSAAPDSNTAAESKDVGTSAAPDSNTAAEAKDVGTSAMPDSNTVAESKDVGTSATPDSNTVAESKDVGTSAAPDSNTAAEAKDVGTSAMPDSNTVAESKDVGTSATPDSNTVAESKDVGTSAVPDSNTAAESKYVETSAAPDSNTVAESKDTGTSAVPDSNTAAESKDTGTSAVPDSNTAAESKDVGTSAVPDSNTVAESKDTGTSAAPDSNTAAESKDVGTSAAPDSNTVAESQDVGTSAAPDSNTAAESKDVGTSAVPDSNTVVESKDVGTTAAPDSNTAAESKDVGTSAAPDSITVAEAIKVEMSTAKVDESKDAELSTVKPIEITETPLSPLAMLLLELHNNYRRSQGAADMEEMEWSSVLADAAVTWASKCTLDTGLAAGLSSGVGQLIYDKKGSFSVSKGVEFWYNSGGNSQNNKERLQILSAASSQLGCATTLCSEVPKPNGKGAPWKDVNILVCYYGPKGAKENQPAFKPGLACSACPEDKPVCNAGLCATRKAQIVTEPAESAQESKTTMAAENAQDSKTTMAPESAQETKTTVAPESAQESKTTVAPKIAQDSKTTMAPEIAQESKTTMALESAQDSKTTMAPESAQESKTTMAPESAQESKTTVAPKNAQESKTTMAPESAQESKTTMTPKSAQESKTTVEANKAAETIVPVEVTTVAAVTDCSTYCDNGGAGSVVNGQCQCQCTDQWQGDQCQNSREEARYGLVLSFRARLTLWDRIWRILQAILVPVINNICSNNVGLCCPAATVATLAGVDFITKDDLLIGKGFPVSIRSRLLALIYVIRRSDNPLCLAATANGRRKRQVVNAGTGYLPQDVLDNALSSAKGDITVALQDCCNTTLEDVQRPTVRPLSGPSSEFSPTTMYTVAGVVAFIGVCMVLFLIIVIYKRNKAQYKVKDSKNMKTPSRRTGLRRKSWYNYWIPNTYSRHDGPPQNYF